MEVLLAALAVAGGLHGTVVRGPITPVCRVGVPCTAPAPGVVLLFRRAGAPAVRVITGSGGRYRVRLREGAYSVRLATPPRIGSGLRPAEVRARRGVDARVDFTIDTGIR